MARHRRAIIRFTSDPFGGADGQEPVNQPALHGAANAARIGVCQDLAAIAAGRERCGIGGSFRPDLEPDRALAGVFGRADDGDALAVGEFLDDVQAAAVLRVVGAVEPRSPLVGDFDADGRSGAAHADREDPAGPG